MSRATKILGKVLRNLKKYGIAEGDITDEEIFSELVDAQDNIISDTFPNKIITITLEENEEYYPLTTDTVTNPALTTYKNNISSVKVVKQPTGFSYPFSIISNIEFVRLIDGDEIHWFGVFNYFSGVDFTSLIKTGIEMVGEKNGSNLIYSIAEDIVEDSEEIFFNGVLQVRDTDYSILNSTITILSGLAPESTDTLVCNYIKASLLGNAIVNTKQPLIGTQVGNRLRVYPVPDSSYADTAIELYAYQKNSVGTIDETTEPELDIEWDKALTYYATSELLSEFKGKEFFMNRFKAEKERLRPIVHKARGVIQKMSAYEGMID